MPPLDKNTFLTGTNAAFIAELYARYLDYPQSVDASWRGFFAELGEEPKAFLREMEGPGWGDKRGQIIAKGHQAALPAPATNGHGVAAAESHAALAELPQDARQATLDSIRAMTLIRAYRVRGHLIADLDPLGLERRTYHPDLDPATYGFTEADYDRPIFINDLLGFETATLRDILGALKATYCGTVGVEYMHMQELEERRWIQARIEVPRNHTEFTPEGKFLEVYAHGLRNCVGEAINPITGSLWCSTNERDNLGNHLVPDYVTSVPEGSFFGWPWYYMGGHRDPRHYRGIRQGQDAGRRGQSGQRGADPRDRADRQGIDADGAGHPAIGGQRGGERRGSRGVDGAGFDTDGCGWSAERHGRWSERGSGKEPSPGAGAPGFHQPEILAQSQPSPGPRPQAGASLSQGRGVLYPAGGGVQGDGVGTGSMR